MSADRHTWERLMVRRLVCLGSLRIKCPFSSPGILTRCRADRTARVLRSKSMAGHCSASAERERYGEQGTEAMPLCRFEEPLRFVGAVNPHLAILHLGEVY